MVDLSRARAPRRKRRFSARKSGGKFRPTQFVAVRRERKTPEGSVTASEELGRVETTEIHYRIGLPKTTKQTARRPAITKTLSNGGSGAEIATPDFRTGRRQVIA